MSTIEPLKAMRIGCDGAVWCPLTADPGSSLPTWSNTVYELPGVMAININPNMSMETAFYDDGPGEVASSLGNIEVTFNKSALGPKEKAMMLGKAMDANGLLMSSAADIAPWGALGFRTLKSDGTYRYVWLYKGKFIEPADNNETKGESVNFQGDEITGRFVKLNYGYTVTDVTSGSGVQRTVHPWKIEFDEATGGSNATKIAADWMTKVIQPNTTFA